MTMPVYEIEQYEIHAQRFRVKARSEAEAIKKLYDGEADAVGEGAELIEVADDIGLPAEENRELADALHKLGVSVDEIISSIRSIEAVE
jgi:hypothetical protein